MVRFIEATGYDLKQYEFVAARQDGTVGLGGVCGKRLRLRGCFLIEMPSHDVDGLGVQAEGKLKLQFRRSPSGLQPEAKSDFLLLSLDNVPSPSFIVASTRQKCLRPPKPSQNKCVPAPPRSFCSLKTHWKDAPDLTSSTTRLSLCRWCQLSIEPRSRWGVESGQYGRSWCI